MLEAVERQIEHYIDDLEDKDASELYHKLPAGKRLRARLILTIAGNSLMAIKSASIVEMIHTASLLHDDVIDEADTRRGKASLHSLYGSKTSIMFGDVLYSKGFYELVNIDSKIAKVISNAVVKLSLGERRDVLLSESFNHNRDSYLKMIYQKTASLIEASVEVGAILAGKNPKIYRIYGRNLGLAFQMIDDILDITQSSDVLGKPSMHDFQEGKTTLPYIYLYESLSDLERKKLVSLHKRAVGKDSTEWIRERMYKTGALQRSQVEARELIEEAIELMNIEGEVELELMARKMIERNY